MKQGVADVTFRTHSSSQDMSKYTDMATLNQRQYSNLTQVPVASEIKHTKLQQILVVPKMH